MVAYVSDSARKRTGRRTGPTTSNGAILETARRQFAERGYEATTMRTIAHEAGVDTSLIHHFFLTKEGLFEAAVFDALNPPDLVARVVEGPRRNAGERLVALFLMFWDEPAITPRLLAVLRSVAASEGAAEKVRELLGVQVLGAVTEAIGRPRPRLRAAMVGAQLIGLATVRYLLVVPPIATMSAAGVVAATAPTYQGLLVGAV